MKHYKTLMNALAGAMPVCMTWKLAGTEEGMNARDVYALALEEGGDEEKLPEQDFYVVSAEGAIGLTTRFEYLTRWIFIPVMGEEREKEMERLRSELKFDRDMAEREAAEMEAGSKAEAGVKVGTSAGSVEGNWETARTAAPHFCSNCGNPLNQGAKFCRHCGCKLS